MRYMVTFTINIPQMLAYIPYMDPVGNGYDHGLSSYSFIIGDDYNHHRFINS